MELNKITEQQIPYDTLEKFGVSREMVDDFPQKVMIDFLSMRPTPILPVVMEDSDGKKIQTKARLVLFSNSTGKADVFFIPEMKTSSFDSYSQEQQKQLLNGQAIMVTSPSDGESHCFFAQYDQQINQVITVPAPVILRNLGMLNEKMELDEDGISHLQNGDIVSVTYENGYEISVGIDLLSRTGIRFSEGGPEKWLDKNANLEKYNFGLYGCWITDDHDGMQYVPENEYTEEIQMEENRAREKNRNAAMFHNLHL